MNGGSEAEEDVSDANDGVCEVREGVSDEEASDVNEGDFHAEKGVSKSGCGCIMHIGHKRCIIQDCGCMYMRPQRYKITPLPQAYKEPNV